MTVTSAATSTKAWKTLAEYQLEHPGVPYGDLWAKWASERPAGEMNFRGTSIWVDAGVFCPDLGWTNSTGIVDDHMPRDLSDCPLVYDVGTGSGILSIRAAKRGAKRVVAFDKDPKAVACARRNVAAYGLEDTIEVHESDLFDVVPEGSGALALLNLPIHTEFWMKGGVTELYERLLGQLASRLERVSHAHALMAYADFGCEVLRSTVIEPSPLFRSKRQQVKLDTVWEVYELGHV